MDTTNLQTFCTVYECSSFSEASRKLFHTSQGIAKTITRLENELGVSLFTRTKKGIIPTKYADMLYEKSKEFQLLFSDITSIKYSKSTPKSTISILSTYGFLSYLGYAFFREFMELHPNIIINAVEVPDSLLPAAFDMKKSNIGFITGPVDDYKFNSFYIDTNKYVVLLPEEHPLAHKKTITLEELSQIPTAIKGKEYNIYPVHFNKFIKNNIYPNIELETSDDSFLFEHVAGRHGGAVILEYQTKLEYYSVYMQKYHLTTCELSNSFFNREIYFAEVINAHLSPAESAFKDYVYTHRKILNRN